jgi:hypothetical protein
MVTMCGVNSVADVSRYMLPPSSGLKVVSTWACDRLELLAANGLVVHFMVQKEGRFITSTAFPVYCAYCTHRAPEPLSHHHYK